MTDHTPAKQAAEILKVQQDIIKSITEDLTRLTHNMEAMEASLGYVVSLLEDSEG